MDLTDIYQVFHPNFTDTYFSPSATHSIFPKTESVSGFKTSLRKYKKSEIPSCILVGRNGIKLAVN